MRLILVIVCVLIGNGVSNPALYDQRQTGDTNVRIDIKDATFILMEGGEMGDYDYSYDYSDLTVKPETTVTTPKPISTPSFPSSTTISTTTTTESSTTINGTFGYVLEKENNTLTITPSKQGANSSEPNKLQISQPQQPLNTHNYQIPVVVITETEKPASPGKPPEKNYVSSSEIRKKNNGNATSIRTEDLPLRNCALGYFLDSKNRCKKIKRPTEQRKRPQLPFGLRFAQRPEAMNA